MEEALKLYLVTDRSLSLGRSLEEVVSEAVAGGVTMVQLREKEASTREFIELAKRIKTLLTPLSIPLIINDRVDVALAVDADGVHIGQSDMPYNIARELLGPDKIIGLSVENIDDLLQANYLDVDYVGISPIFATQTKTDTAKPFGIEGLKEAVRMSIHPTVAIGGMNSTTAAEVMQTGCDGIAVVSAISSAQDVCGAAKELKEIVDANTAESWCQEVWRKSNKIYKAILGQKFIGDLSGGTLELEKFASYIAQDEHYLKGYYAHMLTAAEMMDTPQNREMFTAIAKSGMEGEKLMHEFLIEKYGINTDVPVSEVTKGYVDLIQEGIDTGNRCLALAVMLPCMWIYNRVGLHILKIAKMDENPYKEWILEYGNEEFTQGTRAVLDIIDSWAAKTDIQTREKMTYYYLKAALYEYAFWDYGYEGEGKSYDYAKTLEGWI